jgi:putative spermidine/putrescine transport system permease protein
MAVDLRATSSLISVRTDWPSLCFVLPAAAFTGLVFLVPLWSVLYQSVTNSGGVTLEGYREIASSGLFVRVLSNTFEISLTATMVTVLLAYPIAYHLSKQTRRRRALLMVFVLLPFWTSILVKSYAFMVILGSDGIVNNLLALTGLPAVKLLFNRAGVIIATTHFLIPFVLFPILTSLLAQDPNYARAAQVMGAGRLRIFLRITLPLSMPGVVAGAMLAMIQSFGFFITAALLGGRRDMMMANLVDLYTREILNWTLASAVAVVLLVFACILILLLARLKVGQGVLAPTAA